MMPPPLAPPAGLPMAPAAPTAPDGARYPHEDHHPASAGGDFSGLLAMLAGVLSPTASSPVENVAGAAPGPALSPDGPAAADTSSPSSLEALVSALAQQATGISSCPTTPAGPEPGSVTSDRPPAVARLVDRWAAEAPRSEATGPSAADRLDGASGPRVPEPLPEPGTPPVTIPGPAEGLAAPAVAANVPAGHSGETWNPVAGPDQGRPTDAPTAAPPSPLAPMPGPATPIPVHGDRRDGTDSLAPPINARRDGTPDASPSGLERDDDSTRSPVAALARSRDDDSTRSPVAALAHGRDDDSTRSPVAALAHEATGGGPGSAVAVLAHSDGRGRPAGRAAEGPGGGADPLAGLSSDPPAAVRSVGESGASDTSGSSGPSGAVSRRFPNGAAGPQNTTLPPVGPAPAQPAEAVTAPTEPAPAATPAAVADQIVSAVVPLHGRGDGRHAVTLELRPEELGSIRVEVSVEHQTVHLTLHAAEPATGRLLAAALPDLRSALADAGLTAGRLSVGPDGGNGAGARRGAAEGDGHGSAGPHRRGGDGPDDGRRPGRTDPIRLLRPAAAGRIDLFL